MNNILKVKLILFAFCLLVGGANHIYFMGVDAGIAAVDQQAFDAYAHFAKPMQHEVHLTKAKPAKHESIWSVVDNH
jgi:hypothetical protein